MCHRIRVSAKAVLIGVAMLSGGCIGACDMYSQVKPLGRAFEIRRADMDLLLPGPGSPVHRGFAIVIHRIGVSDRLVVVFDRDPGPCSELDGGPPCGEWWIGDLASGELQGPLTPDAFRQLQETDTEVGKVRIGDIGDVWSEL